MSREAERIAEQLRRAFEGEAWHGPSVKAAIKGLTAQQAVARPIPNAHSIWELVLHIAAWEAAVCRGLRDGVIKVTPEENFPGVGDTCEEAWQRTVSAIEEGNALLRAAILSLDDAALDRPIHSMDDTYSAYVSLHGVVQHDLYHVGQMVLLRKLAGKENV